MKIAQIKNDYKCQTICQWAAGVGDIWSNPDLITMFKYSRENNVVPNVTTNGYGLTDQMVDDITKYCGGVAVSVYDPKDVCYDAIKRITDAKMKQKVLVRIPVNVEN